MRLTRSAITADRSRTIDAVGTGDGMTSAIHCLPGFLLINYIVGRRFPGNASQNTTNPTAATAPSARNAAL
jgi:hypothetical protein